MKKHDLLDDFDCDFKPIKKKYKAPKRERRKEYCEKMLDHCNKVDRKKFKKNREIKHDRWDTK